jgi:hypothetical protein
MGIKAKKSHNKSIQKIFFETRLMMMNVQDRSFNQSNIPIQHGFLVLSTFQLIAPVFCALVAPY